MREICSKYRVKQVSERSYPANFIEKIDEFINLPTGFGKSLTYQALPLICDTVRGTTGHIVVVVSPMVNLMKDQATKLANIGILAVPLSDISEENIECFHSRGQHLCKFIGTKESLCIRKEFNSHRIGLGHQHGRRFIVLGHQYGRRDVM